MTEGRRLCLRRGERDIGELRERQGGDRETGEEGQEEKGKRRNILKAHLGLPWEDYQQARIDEFPLMRAGSILGTDVCKDR